MPSRIALLFSGFMVLAGLVAAHEPGEFPSPKNTQKETIPLLSPREALKKLKLPEGFKATLFAAEPEVQQPISMTFDGRGRLWVAENYTYAESKVNFDLTQSDRIVILEDTDNDGKFDKRTVFWDKGKRLTSIEIGFGGVWALCAPYLYFIPDRDGDDKPDGEPIVVLDGWNESAVRHNIVNGLKWGPDGWLYGRHGILAESNVGVPGTPADKRTKLSCGMWRVHPVTKKFEVVCWGTTNPWGHDWDQHGELFFINTVIGHLWHAVPGAHFRRMYGADPNPHTYQVIEQTADHFHWDTVENWADIRSKGVTPTTDQAGGGHAHSGLMIYQGDNWPEKYRNTLFTLNLHGRRINNDKLERKGAGYVGKHAPDMVFSDDPYFRGIDLITGPDGGVYVADWSDIGECHENDGVHRTSGRIYKIAHGTPTAPKIRDIAKLSDKELADLQLHLNDWYARQSRRVLQERAAAGKDVAEAKSALERTLKESKEVVHRLRALWSLHAIGAAPEAMLLKTLGDESEHVRVWGIQLLAESRQPSAEALDAMHRLAKSDRSGLVLNHLASVLQRIPILQRTNLVSALSKREDFADDPMFPLMLWYGLGEWVLANDCCPAAGCLTNCKIPLVRQFIARRFTEGRGSSGGFASMIRGFESPNEKFPSVKHQKDVLLGIAEGLRGQRKVEAPKGWETAQRNLLKSEDQEVRRLARELGVTFGNGDAIEETKKIATTKSSGRDARRQAIFVLSEAKPADLGQIMVGLLDDAEVAPEAIRALSSLKNADLADMLLGRYRTMSAAGKTETINMLATRPDSAKRLLEAVDSKAIDWPWPFSRFARCRI
ncbi:MAG: PVC-type heme-binding CxxCH protein [Gemmataceae bacterium]